MNNIISEKRNRKANILYNSNEYDILTAAQKRKITMNINKEQKEEKKIKRKENIIKNKFDNNEIKYEEHIKNIVDKRKNTKELNNTIIKKFKLFNKDIKFNKVLSILKSFNNKSISKLPVTINDKNILTIKVNKNLMDRQEIKSLSQKISNEMKNLGLIGNMYTTLKYNENKYRSGEPKKFGQPINLFHGINYEFEDDEDNDQEYFNSFSMYLVEGGKAHGGTTKDNNNMCFYNCLKEILKDNLKFIDGFEFKKYFNISYGDKVKISDISKIEQYLKISINVTGEYIYCSKIISNKVINLKLINEHYTLDNKVAKEELNNNRKISYYNKQRILYNTVNFMCFDGEQEYLLSKEQRNKIYSWETKYILINKSDNKNKTLQDEYNEFLSDANILLKETNETINLYKTGNNKVTALNLFYNMNKHIKPNNILQLEAQFINNASCGALMYAQKGIFNNVYKYDVVSMYPSIMASVQLFPINEGEFIQLSDDEFRSMEFIKYGIYRCVITGNNNLFKFNNLNYYSHIDIKQAQELNLNIKLVCDELPNFLYYSRDKLLTGSELFKQYITPLFELKKKGIKKSKQILNILWGSLSEKNIKTIHINDNDDKTFNINGNITIIKIRPFNNKETLIEYVENDKQFKSNYGRLKPFLLAKGRNILTNLIKDDIDNMVYFHTDGFISKKEMNIKTGSELGNIKYEGYCKQLEIKNLNKMFGEFKI